MTMRFLVNQKFDSSNTFIKLLSGWLNFMRSTSSGPGWTIPRSSNGSTGGAGDYIASYTDLNVFVDGSARSWFVLRQPDGAREWLFYRITTTNYRWRIEYNPFGDFTGGDVWNIPSGTRSYITDDDLTSSNTATVSQFGADDTAPYGWFVYSYHSGSLTDYRWGMAQIPLDVAPDPDDPDPMVCYYNGETYGWIATYLCNITDSGWEGRCMACRPWSEVAVNCPALYYFGTSVPGGLPQTIAAKDVTFPIVFARGANYGEGFYKGASSWLRWNGTARGVGNTFDSKTRISLGDVNVPWDGASDMDLS